VKKLLKFRNALSI